MGRSQRRHNTEKKKARTRKILKRYGTSDWLTDRRVGRFTKSHWGCQCEICQNPRRRNKGKNSDSLTRNEYHLDDSIED
jgi:hypothetical protein